MNIIFAITQGTLAEGIDFRDDLCRALVILGIPMPDINDSYIQFREKNQ